MTEDCLKLTVYFGERDRLDGQLISDVLLDVAERRGVAAAILVRGTEGFGIKHRLHTQRLLTLSEDLPLVSIAVGRREVVEAMLPDVESIVAGGLVTLERARLVRALDADVLPPEDLHGAAKLTLYLGRREQVGRRPAYLWAVDVLRRGGVAGATVVLGVDGIVRHARRRARFLSKNADTPLMVLSVGSGQSIARSLVELAEGLDNPLLTLERVRICKRDGETLAGPGDVPDTDADGLGVWQKLTVYAGEQARHGRHPLYVELIRRLRLEGAAGATAVRGIWGYSGDHPPHGDRLLAVRRRVPVVISAVDRPEGVRRWWPLIDEVTSAAGLVTSEIVPAFQAKAPGIAAGGLRLARLEPGSTDARDRGASGWAARGC